MSRKIYFATGNRGKFLSLQKLFKSSGVAVELAQAKLDLVEPQAETATEVAISKAEQAYIELKQPVIVDDSSFHITALGGFPGPYIKYMLSTIGIYGILEFMKGQSDRSAYFLSTLVYIDKNAKRHVFEDRPFKGVIARKSVEIDREESWSDLYKVFIPSGSTKTLVEMTADEKSASVIDNNSYEQLAEYLKAIEAK